MEQIVTGYVYVGSKNCGCIVACVVDRGSPETISSDIGEMVMDGLKVEKVWVGTDGYRIDGCSCSKDASLASSEAAGVRRGGKWGLDALSRDPRPYHWRDGTEADTDERRPG